MDAIRKVATGLCIPVLLSGCGIVGPLNCTTELGWDFSPTEANLAVGQSITAEAEAFSCGGREQVPVEMRWSSQDSSVAKVHVTTGVITAIAPGNTVILGEDVSRYGIGPIEIPVRVVESCPGAVALREASLWHTTNFPVIAAVPFDGVGYTARDSAWLAPIRDSVGLVALTTEEIRPVRSSETSLCAALEAWVWSQPGLAGEETRMSFSRARDRFLVHVWRDRDRRPNHVATGRYTHTFFAVLDAELRLIEKFH